MLQKFIRKKIHFKYLPNVLFNRRFASYALTLQKSNHNLKLVVAWYYRSCLALENNYQRTLK
jgi:hypothetical protein